MTGSNVEKATEKGVQPQADPDPAAPETSSETSAEAGANTARDGNIAIREEFDAASKANTIDALKLFIDRHPGHPLANMAAEKLQKLQQQKNQ